MLEISSGQTLPQQLEDWARKKPNEAAQFAREIPSGATKVFTWQDYRSRAGAVAQALVRAGLAPGEAVAILGTNRPAWSWCQAGITAARGMVVPIYPNSTPDQTAYILRDCQARFIFCDTPARLSALVEGDALDQLKLCVFMEGQGTTETLDAEITRFAQEQGAHPVTPYIAPYIGPHAAQHIASKLSSLETFAPSFPEDAFPREALPSDVAILMYTSGTTGTPKGVMLTHENLVRMGRSLVHDYREVLAAIDRRALSYLPLSHIAEQIITTLVHLAISGEVYFCPDLKMLPEYLRWARPTVFMGVPRVFEKMATMVEQRIEEANPIRRRLARWALGAQDKTATGFIGRYRVALHRRLADRLVRSKIRRGLGLDQASLVGSGAAPLGPDTMKFFASLGIDIHEAYGMTETTGLLTVPAPGRPIFGTVGRPVPGVEVRIAEDGEICARGATMTPGYYKMPEATAELFDAEGWLHTGDLGRFDERNGYLTITGRKKDLIITAGGKNIAPVEIEHLLRAIPGVGSAIVIGDRKPYLTALLTLDPDQSSLLARATGVPGNSPEELASHPAVHEHLRASIEAHCNARLARYQTIKKFFVLAHPFTVEAGELTPSLKLKRSVINERYEVHIRTMYT